MGTHKMNILSIVIGIILGFSITQLFVILGRKIERLNFENWLLRNKGGKDNDNY